MLDFITFAAGFMGAIERVLGREDSSKDGSEKLADLLRLTQDKNPQATLKDRGNTWDLRAILYGEIFQRGLKEYVKSNMGYEGGDLEEKVDAAIRHTGRAIQCMLGDKTDDFKSSLPQVWSYVYQFTLERS